VKLDAELRTRLVGKLLSCLEEAASGSKAMLRGSLAGDRADQYSDIDVLWEVPDSHFELCVGNLKGILSRIRPVESLRSVPEFQNSKKRRLIFVRFEGVPLFWRLDLEILAQSINRDRQYDLHNPSARGSEWSLTESALMNAVAAIKAHLRSNDDEAGELLARAYQRVGLDLPALELRELVLKLVDEVKVMDPGAGILAEGVKRLVLEAF
jgi:predicted nucleotidyltransferase